jgi:hypothetical protein
MGLTRYGPRLHAARDEFGGRYRRLGEISGRLERSPWRSTCAWLASAATRAQVPDTCPLAEGTERLVDAGAPPHAAVHLPINTARGVLDEPVFVDQLAQRREVDKLSWARQHTCGCGLAKRNTTREPTGVMPSSR